MARTRSEIGRRSRQQGKEYERGFARYLRERYPGADVRRASQAERAANSDVFVVFPGQGPYLLTRIWWELTRGASPNVPAKLVQAERDCLRNGHTGGPGWRIPVVVWNLRGARREDAVTLRASELLKLTSTAAYLQPGPAVPGWNPMLTLGLDAFLVLLEKVPAALVG